MQNFIIVRITIKDYIEDSYQDTLSDGKHLREIIIKPKGVIELIYNDN